MIAGQDQKYDGNFSGIPCGANPITDKTESDHVTKCLINCKLFRERSGSVVECLTYDRGAAGSSLTGVTALWSLSKTHLS